MGYDQQVGASRCITALTSGWPRAITHNSCTLLSEPIGSPPRLTVAAACLLSLCSTEQHPTCREADRGHLVSHLVSKQTISSALSRITQPEPGRQPDRKGALGLAPLRSSWRVACPLKKKKTKKGAATIYKARGTTHGNDFFQRPAPPASVNPRFLCTRPQVLLCYH